MTFAEGDARAKKKSQRKAEKKREKTFQFRFGRRST